MNDSITKEQVLALISEKIEEGEITKEEVLAVVGTEHVPSFEQKESKDTWKKHFSATKIFYYLGGAIVILGILFFIAQIWDDIGSAGRIGITLVLGFVFAGLGSNALVKEREKMLGPVLHTIGGVLIPSGALVTLTELGGVPTQTQVMFVIGIIFLFYAVLALHHRHVILTLFAIANGTAFLFLLVEVLFSPSDTVFQYVTLVVGISYLLLAREFISTWNKRLVGLLHVFGAIAIFQAGFILMVDFKLWELFYAVISFGGIAYAAYAQSRGILFVSTIGLISYFAYITAEYFADSIGWPLALILLGFVLIGVGYGSIKVNKKYLKKVSK